MTIRYHSNQEPSDPDVTFFLPDLRGGGAQQIFCNLAAGFASRKYDVDLLVTWANGDLREQVPENVRLVELDPPHVPVAGSAAGLPAMVRYLDSERPKVLYSAMAYANISAITAVKLANSRTAVVPTVHTMVQRHQKSLKDRFVTRMSSLLYLRADAVVAVSESVALELAATIRMDKSGISVIRNPIVTDEIAHRATAALDDPIFEDATDVLLSVGRLSEEKDFSTLLRALSVLVSEYGRDSSLILLGEGPQRVHLRELVEEIGLRDQVCLPGYVDNPYRYMSRASVFVSSSRFEGLPTAIVEAMACGCPIVATDCPGGTAEVLENGSYGELVPVGDPSALAAAIDRTLRRPPDRELLRSRAEDFATKTVVDEHVQLVESLSQPRNSKSQ